MSSSNDTRLETILDTIDREALLMGAAGPEFLRRIEIHCQNRRSPELGNAVINYEAATTAVTVAFSIGRDAVLGQHGSHAVKRIRRAIWTLMRVKYCQPLKAIAGPSGMSVAALSCGIRKFQDEMSVNPELKRHWQTALALLG